MHTTNYFDTFIAVAPDTSALQAMVPPARTKASVAELTYRLIAENPYRHTSDDVIFTVWADRGDIPEARRLSAREEFFSHGQPCLRSSDLGKRYGWGVHSNAEGRVALVPLGSVEYERFASGATPEGVAVAVQQAMRSSRG
ncbi:MAG: hypothetical protein JWP32_2227 [Schumannella sp.]|nr:hypothetical protein [Schumannella sp.]